MSMPVVSYCGMVHEDPEAFIDRMGRVCAALAAQDIGAALITPGPDLAYLTGYEAVPLERLTCLILRPDHAPVLVVPLLEEPAARASSYGSVGADVITWGEIDDPYALVARVVGDVRKVAVDDHMWAAKVLGLRSALPHADQVLAGSVVTPLRMRKTAYEVEALREAGSAIDRVHALVPSLLRVGRTEREVGRDIADAILAEGHVRVDFVIVASGPHGASPHHEVSDRALAHGDPVVIDIGGTMPSGYRSDCTRTYALGEPDEAFVESYSALELAQREGVLAVRPGVTCETVDHAARQVLAEAGLGQYFIHRTGHGIGLETHEDPYMVEGNLLPLEPGMAFSVEPGFYIPGRFGARIEDIVVCGEDGPIILNNRPRELIRVDA